MSVLILIFGLVLVLEGVVYALFPTFFRRMLEEIKIENKYLRVLSDDFFRIIGLVLLGLGVTLVWLVR